MLLQKKLIQNFYENKKIFYFFVCSDAPGSIHGYIHYQGDNYTL